MPIVNRVADLHADITGWRRDLQMHTEPMYDVHRTAGSVAKNSRLCAATRSLPVLAAPG